jgi:hypothetical protein
VKGTKIQTSKKEGRESKKNPNTTESMRGDRKFRSTESARERKMMARFRCGNENRENR